MRKAKSNALQDIDKRHYGYWRTIVMAFYSSALYVDVAKRWKRLSLPYLLLICMLFTLPLSARLVDDFVHFFEQDIVLPLQGIPTLVIQNGEVMYDGEMPYLIKNKLNQVVGVIDTRENAKADRHQYPKLRIFIQKKSLTFWPPSPNFFFSQVVEPEQKAVVQPLSPEMNEVINGQEWLQSSNIKQIMYLSIIIIFPTTFLVFFIIYFIFLLVLALMAQFVASALMKVKLNYFQSFRLLMVASTAELFLTMLFLTLNLRFPALGLLLLIVLSVYFAFAVLSVKKTNNKLVRT